MELFIFARFHAREGRADDIAAAIAEVLPRSRAEPGCRSIAAFSAVAAARGSWDMPRT